jgi:hypothetical protein
MINLDDRSMAVLKGLSKSSGLPITTFARLLIASGLPAVAPLLGALDESNVSTARKFDVMKSLLEDIREEGIEAECAAAELHDEKQLEDRDEVQLEFSEENLEASDRFS